MLKTWLKYWNDQEVSPELIAKTNMFKYNEIKLTAKFKHRYFLSACLKKNEHEWMNIEIKSICVPFFPSSD